jgi:hypothetical protein
LLDEVLRDAVTLFESLIAAEMLIVAESDVVSLRLTVTEVLSVRDCVPEEVSVGEWVKLSERLGEEVLLCELDIVWVEDRDGESDCDDDELTDFNIVGVMAPLGVLGGSSECVDVSVDEADVDVVKEELGVIEVVNDADPDAVDEMDDDGDREAVGEGLWLEVGDFVSPLTVGVMLSLDDPVRLIDKLHEKVLLGLEVAVTDAEKV